MNTVVQMYDPKTPDVLLYAVFYATTEHGETEGPVRIEALFSAYNDAEAQLKELPNQDFPYALIAEFEVPQKELFLALTAPLYVAGTGRKTDILRPGATTPARLLAYVEYPAPTE